jgi:hypothetical protein
MAAALEPIRYSPPTQFPGYLRRQWKREHAAVLIEEHLKAVVKELRLGHAYKMENRLIEMHIALGERITAQIAANDNPLIKEALLRQWENWQRRSEQLLEG